MKSINKPSLGIKDFYPQLCKQMKETNKLKAKFQRLYPKMILEERRLATFATSLRAHQYIPTDYNIGELLSKPEAEELFEKFKRSSAAKYVKRELLETINTRKCVYCEKRGGGDSLDHILPKSVYTFLSVTPTNLVACCSQCNSKKNDYIEGIVHSYFESFNQYNFIKCNVKVLTINGELSLNVNYVFDSFGVTEYERDLSSRLEKMVKRLNLLKRYEDDCIEYIVERLEAWQTDSKNGQKELLYQLNKDMSSAQNSYSANSFIISFYRSFIESINLGNITVKDIISLK